MCIRDSPNDEYAAEHENGSLGKTECWYVLDCEPGATIIVGQRAKDRAEAAQMIEEGRWDDMLNVLPIHKGDFFQIDSGTVHAIKAGTLILETQQSCDVTYRLYDYDRPGTDGKLRPLHIEQSLDCINFNAQAPTDGTVTAPEVDGVTAVSYTHLDVDKRQHQQRPGARQPRDQAPLQGRAVLPLEGVDEMCIRDRVKSKPRPYSR